MYTAILVDDDNEVWYIWTNNLNTDVLLAKLEIEKPEVSWPESVSLIFKGNIQPVHDDGANFLDLK
jgi:hypothetical protein